MISSFFISIFILLSLVATFQGFKDNNFFKKYIFQKNFVLEYKQYERVLSFSFLHDQWAHFFINMTVLYFLNKELVLNCTLMQIIILFFSTILMYTICLLFLHKKNIFQSYFGAYPIVLSFATATLLLSPGETEFLSKNTPYFLLIILGIFYAGFIVYLKLQNTSHISFLALCVSAIVGVANAFVFSFEKSISHPYTLIAIIFLSFLFVFLLFQFPSLLLLKKDPIMNNTNYTIDDQYNRTKKVSELSINDILDKINKKGLKSLSNQERKFLDEYSNS